MVTGSTKAKSYKTFFDDAPPLVGFYYPSPQKCLGKGPKKIDIRAERQGSNVLQDDSEEFTITGRNSATSFTFNESWSSTEHDYGEPPNREEHADQKFADREFWLDNVAKSKILHHQDEPATNSGSEDQDSSWDSTFLGGSQKLASLGSISRQVLQVQKRANKLLKSAKPLYCSATRDNNCLTNEGIAEDTNDSKQNSTLENDSLLNDIVSNGRKGNWLNEKKPSTHIPEGQVEKNADDISVDSSDFLVSTEGLARSSGTIASSDEMLFRPSFVNIQDTNENKRLDHYTSDLPFCQYWKSNLNEDILYQWRIKRRIQLAREEAKSEKRGSVPSRIFTQAQVNAEVQTSPLKPYPTSGSHSRPSVESYLGPTVRHDNQVSACSHMNCDIQPSKHTTHNNEKHATPFITLPGFDPPQNGKRTKNHKYPVAENPTSGSHSRPSAESYLGPTVWYDNQVSACTHMNCDIQPSKHTTHNNEKHATPFITLPGFDPPRNGKRTKNHKYPVAENPTSGSHSRPSAESYLGPTVWYDNQVSACTHMNCDIQPSKHTTHNNEKHATPFITLPGFDPPRNGKRTKNHKYLVAEKPHCSNFDSNIPSSRQNKNKNFKNTKNVSKTDKFHGQRLKVNTRMENKSLQTDPKDLNYDPCKSQTVLTYSKHTDEIDSWPHQNYHQTSISGESTESPNELTDGPLQFNDYHSSSDEEFSSDLMLQHLRKQRSKFKEQLRVIDEKLKVLLNSTPD